MKYIYIFDYTFGHIYEITLSNKEYNKITNIAVWLFRHYRIKYTNSDYMVSDKKLEIETIDKIN